EAGRFEDVGYYRLTAGKDFLGERRALVRRVGLATDHHDGTRKARLAHGHRRPGPRLPGADDNILLRHPFLPWVAGPSIGARSAREKRWRLFSFIAGSYARRDDP